MLDIKKIRENFDEVKSAVELRGKGDYQIGRTIELDEDRRKLLAEMESLRAEQKRESRRIPQMKKAGEDTTELMAEMKKLSDRIGELDEKVKEVQEGQSVCVQCGYVLDPLAVRNAREHGGDVELHIRGIDGHVLLHLEVPARWGTLWARRYLSVFDGRDAVLVRERREGERRVVLVLCEGEGEVA